MSLNRSWDYNGKKLTIYYPVVNAFITGALSRDSFVKQVAPLLTHDPLLLIEILSYMDGVRSLLSHGKLVEKNQVVCKDCRAIRKLVLEDHREFSGVKEKYLLNFEDCRNCFEFDGIDDWRDY